MIDKNKLIEFVTPYYEGKDIMHNLSHIERIFKTAYKIKKSAGVELDEEILEYAAYFHGFIYNAEADIKKWLQESGVPQEKIEYIIICAWESQKCELAKSVEGIILHDAHMIEGGKTYIVTKSLITGSLRGQTLEETIKYIEENILDKGICYLPQTKLQYARMQGFAKQFIRDLKKGLD